MNPLRWLAAHIRQRAEPPAPDHDTVLRPSQERQDRQAEALRLARLRVEAMRRDSEEG